MAPHLILGETAVHALVYKAPAHALLTPVTLPPTLPWPPGPLAAFPHIRHAPHLGLRSTVSCTWNYSPPSPTLGLCSYVTFSVRPSMTTLFKILTHPSQHPGSHLPSSVFISIWAICYLLTYYLIYSVIRFFVCCLLSDIHFRGQGFLSSSLTYPKHPEQCVVQGIHYQ